MKTKILILSVIILSVIILSVSIFFITRDRNIESVNDEFQNDSSSSMGEEFYESEEVREEALVYKQQYFSELADIAESINVKIDAMINETISNLPQIPAEKNDELDILYSKFDELRAEKIIIPEKPSDNTLLEYDKAIGQLELNLLEFDEQLLYQLSIDGKNGTGNSFERYVDYVIEYVHFERTCRKQVDKIKKISTNYSTQTQISEAKKHFKAGDKFKSTSLQGTYYIIGYLKIIDDTHYEWYDGYSDSTGEHIDSEPMKSGTWTIGNYYGGLVIVLYSEGEATRHWVISDDYNQLTGDSDGHIYIRQ